MTFSGYLSLVFFFYLQKMPIKSEFVCFYGVSLCSFLKPCQRVGVLLYLCGVSLIVAASSVAHSSFVTLLFKFLWFSHKVLGQGGYLGIKVTGK